MRIVSPSALSPSQLEMLRTAAPNAEIRHKACRRMEEISELVQGGCDVLLTFRIPDDLMQGAPELKWVQLLSAGADHALKSPIANSSLQITTASGIHATAIAEYVFGSMLAYAHRFHITIRAQSRREWIRAGSFMATVDEIRGKVVAIIGYGSIGRETERLEKAFGMRVLALKRDPAARSDPGWSPSGVGDP